MSINPFQAPTAEAQFHIDSTAKELLSRVRPAVLCVAAATILFTLGSVMSSVTTLWFFSSELRNPFEDPAQAKMARLIVFASTQQLIMACGFGYLSWVVVRYAKAIRRATEHHEIPLSEVFTIQRSCWYAAAIVAAIFVVLRVVSVVLQ